MTLLQKILIPFITFIISSGIGGTFPMPAKISEINNNAVNDPGTLQTPLEVENHIRLVFDRAGEPTETAVAIARCESSFQIRIIGDGHLTCKATGLPIRSRGVWQINDCAHPEISDSQAFNPVWATNWALGRFQAHAEKKEWANCFKKI